MSGNGIAVGDFNGDGSPDLAVGGVTVLLNKIPQLASTTTALTASSNAAVYGQTLTLTATVTTNGSFAPSGTVTFTDGSNTLGSANLVNGAASLSTAFTTLGTHTINASYSGDAHDRPSSNSLSVAVNQDVTTTNPVSMTNPSSYGQSVMLTATVGAALPGSGTPTGTVTFYDGAVALGSSALSNGTATVSVTTLTVGTHSITATYSGDTNFTGSTSGALSQVVNPAATTTTVSSNLEPAQVNQPVTYTVLVSGAYGAAATGFGHAEG